jgi:hypothetical protein
MPPAIGLHAFSVKIAEDCSMNEEGFSIVLQAY